MYLQPLFLLVLGWMIDGRDIPGRMFAAIRPFLNLYFAIAFLLFATPLLIRAASARTRSANPPRRGHLIFERHGD